MNEIDDEILLLEQLRDEVISKLTTPPDWVAVVEIVCGEWRQALEVGFAAADVKKFFHDMDEIKTDYPESKILTINRVSVD